VHIMGIQLRRLQTSWLSWQERKNGGYPHWLYGSMARIGSNRRSSVDSKPPHRRHTASHCTRGLYTPFHAPSHSGTIHPISCGITSVGDSIPQIRPHHEFKHIGSISWLSLAHHGTMAHAAMTMAHLSTKAQAAHEPSGWV
jgi:hypothetical protein